MSAKNITDYRNSFSLVPNNLHDCKKRAQTFRGPHASVQVSYSDYTTCNGKMAEGTAKPGPTTDTSSRIARLKKLQKRTRANTSTNQSEGGTDRGAHSDVQNASSGADPKSKRAQLFGHYRNVPGQTSGIGGSSSDVIYFKNVFERLNLNNPPANGNN